MSFPEPGESIGTSPGDSPQVREISRNFPVESTQPAMQVGHDVLADIDAIDNAIKALEVYT